MFKLIINKIKKIPKHSSQKKPNETKASNEIDVEERELTYYMSNNNNDDIDRIHNIYFFRKTIFKTNFSAPVKERLVKGCKVLDIGCGPGTWLLNLASEYENSRFIGVDIKRIYPTGIKPANLDFKQVNIFNGLPFPDNSFDFTHQELMQFIINKNQWEYIISEIIRVTKPGGFIEIVEYINPQNSGPILNQIYKIHSDLCIERGVNFQIIPSLDRTIQNHPSITEVHRDEKTFIIGPQGGKIGTIALDILTMFTSSRLATEDVSYNYIPKAEYLELLSKLPQELEKTKPELSICRFWARKNTQ